MKQKSRTIRAQIFYGYMVIIALTVAMAAASLVFLALIRWDYEVVNVNRNNQSMTQEAVNSHYAWLDNLNISIQTGAPFTGSLDDTACLLGQWIAGVDPADLQDSVISSRINEIMAPHKEIHALAKGLLEQSKTDRPGAVKVYADLVKPQVNLVIEGLSHVSDRYKEFADAGSRQLQSFIVISIISSLVLAGVAILFALLFGKKISDRISNPIVAIAEWSRKLSLGAESVDFGKEEAVAHNDDEVGVMMQSFRQLAKSVQENAEVVRRVADGDMTAFVSIRSAQDSLGKNLYRMVQSNDLLFAEILQIAQTVASGSGQIAQASQSLAESAGVQASAVDALSSTIDEAGQLIAQNAEKTHTATDISIKIKADAGTSSEKMNQLVSSVAEIRDASEKISAVIKTIEDIAFQTNILALNAAIEAARAGAAGKGFAVVANEVRDLALKSATAAETSKGLIEDTIRKTLYGSKTSAETAEIFALIMQEIDEIVRTISDISQASDAQLGGIQKVRGEIEQITQAAASNAAVSQESAASSEEMSSNADLLRHAMGKFQLRQRIEGRAYIPPEKQDDAEFIRLANENYQRAVRTHQLTPLMDSDLLV